MRDHNTGDITKFVDHILAIELDLPSWAEVQQNIHLSLERSDNEFGDAIHLPITDDIHLVTVYTPPDESRIVWIGIKHLKKWNISQKDILAVARMNMAVLVGKYKVVVESKGSSYLAYFDSDSPFKASFILSPKLKEQLPKELGWPVLAVVPARDFVYFLKEGDNELINKVGSVVVKEFAQSGYPITKELLKISDQGIEAIGAFDTVISGTENQK